MSPGRSPARSAPLSPPSSTGAPGAPGADPVGSPVRCSPLGTRPALRPAARARAGQIRPIDADEPAPPAMREHPVESAPEPKRAGLVGQPSHPSCGENSQGATGMHLDPRMTLRAPAASGTEVTRYGTERAEMKESDDRRAALQEGGQALRRTTQRGVAVSRPPFSRTPSHMDVGRKVFSGPCAGETVA